MFCPQCGQQQASNASRFCSRCGFQLAAVAGLLATGGAAPEMSLAVVPGPDSPKRKGARQGGKLMLSGLFLAPALGLLSEMIGSPVELVILGVIVFLAGLFRLLYALIFEDGPYSRQLQHQPAYTPPQQFAPPHEASALPPPQAVPARGYAPPPRATTGEIAYRPSVTEGTTRLLDNEREGPSR